jgi:cytochrome c oxidase subunit 4
MGNGPWTKNYHFHYERHFYGRCNSTRRTCWWRGILSVLTIVELALGFWMMGMPLESGMRLAVKGAIVILMMAKAFYIVAYFMHLKHEIKNLIMTIVVPLMLFVWFIVAFLYDGNSFRNLRNTYDPHFKEQSTIKVAPKEEGKKEDKKTVE